MKVRTILGSMMLTATMMTECSLALAAPQAVRFEPAVATSQARYVEVAQRRRVVRRRSKKKSAAIVAGSAAGGAAIGALAGGGKGAAIGAAAGGGTGLIYDRATHKKVVR